MSQDPLHLSSHTDNIETERLSLESKEKNSDLSNHVGDVARMSFEGDFREAVSEGSNKTTLSKSVTKGSCLGTGFLSGLMKKASTRAQEFFRGTVVQPRVRVEGPIKKLSDFNELLSRLDNLEKNGPIRKKIDKLFNAISKLDELSKFELTHDLNLLYNECKSDIKFHGQSTDKAVSAIDKRLNNFARLNGHGIEYKCLLARFGVPIKKGDPILSFFQDKKVEGADKYKLLKLCETALKRMGDFSDMLIDEMMSSSSKDVFKVIVNAREAITNYDDNLKSSLSFLDSGSLKNHKEELGKAVLDLANPKLSDVVKLAYKDLSSKSDARDGNLEKLLQDKKASFEDQVKAFITFRDSLQ